MMIFPKNYKEIYPCINKTGFSADIHANEERTEAYKIYRKSFDYQEDKFKQLQRLSDENCTNPIDTIAVEGHLDTLIGYKMKYDDGIVLAYLRDGNIEEIVEARDRYLETLKEISSYQFLVSDPNINNISFKKTFRFLDVYSFTWVKRISEDKIFARNLKKSNETIICGLIDFDYKRKVTTYLEQNHSKYLDLYLQLNKESPTFISDVLSIIEEETGEQNLQSARQKVISIGKK